MAEGQEDFKRMIVQCFQARMFEQKRSIADEARRLQCPRSTVNDVIQGRRQTQEVLEKMAKDLISAK